MCAKVQPGDTQIRIGGGATKKTKKVKADDAHIKAFPSGGRGKCKKKKTQWEPRTGWRAGEFFSGNISLWKGRRAERCQRKVQIKREEETTADRREAEGGR